LGSQAEPEAEMELMNSSNIKEKGSMIDHWFVWCALCSHGKERKKFLHIDIDILKNFFSFFRRPFIPHS